MAFEFKFIDREDELYQLQDAFMSDVIQQKKCTSFPPCNKNKILLHVTGERFPEIIADAD